MSDTVERTSELQRLWKSLVKLFPTWSLPLDWFFSPSSYHMLGADLIRGQLNDPRVRRASGLLAPLAADTIESLSLMARLNEERATSVFCAVAVCYVTLPIALAALLSEAAPDAMSTFITARLDTIGPLLFALIVTPIVYFFGMWRAKQIVWAIDLHRAGGVAPVAAKKR